MGFVYIQDQQQIEMEMAQALAARPTVTVTITAAHCGPTADPTPTAPSDIVQSVSCTRLTSCTIRDYTNHYMDMYFYRSVSFSRK